jgi:uncharacterized protein (DUF885 family)
LILYQENLLRMITKGLILASSRVFVICLFATIAFAQAPEKAPAPNATKALYALFGEEWEHGLQESPLFASSLGDRRYATSWGDASLKHLEAEYQRNKQVLKKLAGIDRSKLSAMDQVNYDLFKRNYTIALADHELGFELVPVNQREGVQLSGLNSENLPFTSVQDYEDWIARIRNFPAYLKQNQELMEEGLRRGIKYPKVIMQRVVGQLDREIVDDPTKSSFYAPFRKFEDFVPEAERQRLAKEAQEAIMASTVPAFRSFKDFFANRYLAQSFDQVGVWQWPNGGEAYAHAIRKYTTLDITPEKVHEIGLSEVKRIRGEMEKIKERTGFKGTMPEFFTFLRTDRQFYYKTSEELLEAYRATAKRIDPNLTKLFSKLPRQPYGVEPIPAVSAPDTTAAYYQPGSMEAGRPGTYAVNLYKPESRPKWEMMALSLHESVPGHHLQGALAQEMGEVPKFRRFLYYSAYGEGWGLYSEALGDEMGLYDDPYSKFGQLVYEMWRAVRLVVDTGMHYKHWTRQQAIDYFMENAAKTEQDVVNEIDRYIYWPGQALSYKLGELKIKELRARATKELGPNFNVKEFHEVVLGSGAIPLDMLEKNVNAWIARKQAAPTP